MLVEKKSNLEIFPENSPLVKKIIKALDEYIIYDNIYKTKSEYQEGFAKCNVSLCGGAIASIISDRPINDLDLYVNSIEDLDKLQKLLFSYGYHVEYATANAISYKDDEGKVIQVITLYYGNVEKIIGTYDFVCCQLGYCFNRKEVIATPDAYINNICKELVFEPNNKYPLNTLLRLNKYTCYGYHMNSANIIKLVLHIVRFFMTVSTKEQLIDQFAGVYGERDKVTLLFDKSSSYYNEEINMVFDLIVEQNKLNACLQQRFNG